MSIGWWDILKSDIRNQAQYEAASLKERMTWHGRQARAYDRRLQALRTHRTVDLTDIENPVYKEMKEYQEMRNFHSRQAARIKKCLALDKTECNDYYSMELEGDNRKREKLITTPTGKRNPYVEVSLETYNNLTDRQKLNYHEGMKKEGIDTKFHTRMMSRLKNAYKQPTVPSPKHGGESALNLETTKEEYDNMDKTDKQRFHSRMQHRTKQDEELRRFHSRMFGRLQTNSTLPTYYSPEHEQEES